MSAADEVDPDVTTEGDVPTERADLDEQTAGSAPADESRVATIPSDAPRPTADATPQELDANRRV
ncbi:hypothetical protein IC607_13485 [Cellulomonas sp. JH27-2]|uniref:hypothetical protein n=1 Tax=Cellulomonas sp. JH27-2 TaxID=2774139 RepID=UPI00177FAB21|nr:hypothetical protein [Cellulomonas sp. JH27-2]MBD8059981.1 hypothetical protein [Cellulomonas sp. JH27-2]